MAGVLLIAEASGEQLAATTAELVAEGGRLAKELGGGPVTVLLAGKNVQGLASSLGQLSGVEVLEEIREQASTGPKLKDAKVIVSGGRGLGGPENWHVVEELAQLLGGAVGATRAVTDAGWVPPSHQVGLTGATVAPDLYITIGISGAVQHIAGISGARNVVAINRDADANIFKYARYGVVGDWKQILPAFTQRLKELRG